MKNVLIINGHPDKQSFNHALSKAYCEGLRKAEASVTLINIADLTFNPNLAYGYRQRIALEPDLEDAVEKIRAAHHLVWVFPMWWYGYPAIMKGFVDRVFLPGITFQPVDKKNFPEKLLKGKSGRIIITADTPGWYDWLLMKSPAINQFKKGTLEFCGVKPVKVTYIAPVKDSSQEFRLHWLRKVNAFGTQDVLRD
jgi:putative NADPH-quinone reductase